MIERMRTAQELRAMKGFWISVSIPRSLVGLVLLFFIPASASGEIRFEDISQRAGVFNRSPTAASAWGDFNNDGWPDLWVSNHLGKPPSLYLNRKDGTFINITEKVLSDYADVDFHGAAWADFDNDGDQDLIVLTGGGGGRGRAPNFFFVNEDGQLINKAKDLGLDYLLGRGRTPLWIDADRDGKLDVLMMNHPRAEAPSAIFLQTPKGFVERSQELGFRNLPPSRIENILARMKRLMKFRWPDLRTKAISTFTNEFAQLADISGKNQLDLVAYMQHSRMFSVNDARFHEITNDIVFPNVSFVQDAALEDFNGDGQIDWYLARGRLSQDVTQTSTSSFQGELRGSPKDAKAVRFRTEGEVTFGIYRFWMDPTEPDRETKPQVFIGSKRLELTDPTIKISPDNPTVREPAPSVTAIGESIFIEFDQKSKVWTFKSSVRRIGFVITSTKSVDAIQPEGFETSKGYLPNVLMIRDEDGFAPRRLEPTNASSACVSVAAGDFDNDGDVDLYLVFTEPTKNAPNMLLENDGNGNFVEVPKAGGAEGSSRGRGNQVATADFDRDGFLDLFVTNGDGISPFADEGPHQLFRNLGNANNWIEIDLEGVVSNRDGIGAKVILNTGGKVQVRQQDGGMHSSSQDHARIHFGLGAQKKVDALTIFWPSGAVQHLKDIQANQILVVREQA
jgi:hypothetical protein